ncbi:MAG TPA: glycosyltransferase, partial [Acidimicrobiales bacterium]|nr:glycosyltransferase [Acidimicrobiales bacterium]
RAPVASHRQLLLGLGVDHPAAGGARRPAAAAEGPYLLCLGRVDRQKGVHLLVELFRAHKARNPGPLRLVVAGPVVEEPPPAPEVEVLGPVDEATKWALLDGAVALVSPSPWEAFSMVVAEAWSAGTPVLVHAGCAATVEHCRRSGGGVAFAGFAEFEVAVGRLWLDPGWRELLGSRGRAYVDRNLRWPRVVRRYGRFLERVAASGRDGGRRRARGQGAEPRPGQEMPPPKGRVPAVATTGTPSTA